MPEGRPGGSGPEMQTNRTTKQTFLRCLRRSKPPGLEILSEPDTTPQSHESILRKKQALCAFFFLLTDTFVHTVTHTCAFCAPVRAQPRCVYP